MTEKRNHDTTLLSTFNGPNVRKGLQLVHRDYEYPHLTLMERCTFILERRSSIITSKGEEILLIAKGMVIKRKYRY